MRRLLAVVASIFVAAVVGASLTLMQSPGTARLRKADDVRVRDVEAIRDAVRHYAGSEGRLPESLDVLTERSQILPDQLRDPVAGTAYGYRIVDSTRFEVCARFALDARDQAGAHPRRWDGGGEDPPAWLHGAGEQCFRFTSERPK